MIYTPATDTKPLKQLLGNLQAEMPEGTSCTWIKVRQSGVEVSFYYQNQTDGTYMYRTVMVPKKPVEFAKLLAETFNVEFAFVSEIVLRFNTEEFATVTFEREITEANINVINYRLGFENEHPQNS